MLTYNPRTHTLEYSGHEYKLREPAEPQLFREQMPFSEPPKLSWNHRLVPLAVPADIRVVDSTFVDGQRGRRPYDAGQTLRLFELIVRLGGPNGVIRETEMPFDADAERQALERCLERDYPYPAISARIDRPNAEAFARVKALGLREAGFAVPASDYLILLRRGASRGAVIEEATARARAALERAIVPRCHLEDVTRGDIFGFVVPLVKALLAVAEEARSKVKIRLCDTFGIGVPYNGVSLPRSVPALVNALIHYAGVPSEWLEWSGTNDLYKVVSNAASAWLYGAAGCSGTLFGLGERTGHCPLEALVMEYAQLRGTLDGADPTALADLAAFARRELGLSLPSHMPLVGERACLVHLDGDADRAALARHPEAFHGFDTERLLGRSFEPFAPQAPQAPQAPPTAQAPAAPREP